MAVRVKNTAHVSDIFVMNVTHTCIVCVITAKNLVVTTVRTNIIHVFIALTASVTIATRRKASTQYNSANLARQCAAVLVEWILAEKKIAVDACC